MSEGEAILLLVMFVIAACAILDIAARKPKDEE